MTTTSQLTSKILQMQIQMQQQAAGMGGYLPYIDPDDEDETPEPKSLRHIFGYASAALREWRRKFGRITLVSAGLLGTVVGMIFTAIGVSLHQGNTVMTTTTSATAFNAKYVMIPHTFWEFAQPLSVAGIGLILMVLGIVFNWRLRSKYSDKYEIKTMNGMWAGLGTVIWGGIIVGTLFTGVTYSNGLQNETANNWLVQNQHVLSDTDYAGSVDTTKEYLTHNTDGKLVAFTVSRDGDGLHVLVHDAPVDAQAK